MAGGGGGGVNAILGSRDFSLFGEQGNKQIYFRETMEQVSTPGRHVCGLKSTKPLTRTGHKA